MMHKICPFIEYDIPNERFIPIRNIPGVVDVVEGRYLISDCGRIISLNNGKHNLISLNYNQRNGYVYCKLSSPNGGMNAYRVSRLVLLMFNYFEGCEFLEANHKNGLKDDNRLCNLEWLSHRENILHSIENGFTTWKRSLTDEQVKEIRIALVIGLEKRENIAKRFNTTMNIINDIASGRIYQHVSIKEFEDLLSERAKSIPPDIIMCIYDDLLHGIEIDVISRKYNVEYFVIGCIRTGHPVFKDIIQSTHASTYVINRRLDDNTILTIYNEFKNGKSEKRIAIDYDISMTTASQIRSCSGPYEFLKVKYGIEPIARHNVPLPEEVIVDIFKKAGYMTVKDLVAETKISPKTIVDIKHCKGRFSFLIDKYGFTPYGYYTNSKNE